MNENKILKIGIVGTIFLLGLTIAGVNVNFNSLRWSILFSSLGLALISLFSRRYYWGITFLVFTALFNPWVRPSLSQAQWIFADTALSTVLISWFFDYFNNYHKGLLFERLIRNRFPEPTYMLKDATKDLFKRLKRFVESDLNPDLVFQNRVTREVFAIECKYRSRYTKNNHWGEGITWRKEQGERYLQYSQKNKFPVYIAIGIGGNPKTPGKIAFIPIEIIQRQYFNFIPREVIEQYANQLT